MKSRVKFEKTASSALIFTALGALVVALSPAQAASEVDTTAQEKIESSIQGFSASTDSVKLEAVGAQHSQKESKLALTNSQTKASSQASKVAAIDKLPAPELGSKSQALKNSPSGSSTLNEALDSPSLVQLPSVAEIASATLRKTELTEADSSVNLPNIATSGDLDKTTESASFQTEIPVSRLELQDKAPQPASVTAQALPAEEMGEQELPANEMPVDPLLEAETAEDNGMDQVTNVSQLSDVRPTDWAYEALRSLVERYGCIAGYPDGTFRGNRALSRYEFAAGVNACLNQIEKLIAVSGEGGATREDLERLQRLLEEFGPELATLRTRVDNLEGRTAFLEDHQFSTTTKLFGQAIVGVQGRNENDFEVFLNRFEDPGTNINVITNVQLSLFTQLSPRSLLLTGLAAGEGSTAPRLTNDVIMGYEADSDNDIQLSDLTYRQLLGNKFAFIVGPRGVNPVNVFRGANRVESAGQGSLSRFAQRNPILNIGNGDSGVGFDWQVAPRLSFQGVYATNRANDPDEGGIFGGNNGETVAGAQLNFSPTNNIDLAFHYLNSYSPFGRLGTSVGDDQLAVLSGTTFRAPINTNAVGATLEWRISPGITIGGWAGYTNSKFQPESGSVETINWMAFLNFPDLFGQGNLAGFYVGQPPKIIDSDLPLGRNIPDFISKGGFGDEGGQPGTTTHWEAFYRIRVSDNISITPGVIFIFDPGHNYDNDTITIGAIRTTFTF